MATPFNTATMAAAQRLLQASGLPQTPDATRLAAGWIQSEGGLQNNNPLNTTLQAPGVVGNVNSVGVKKFGNLDQGIAADAQTLAASRYAGIRAALKAGNQDQFIQAVGSSPWGTSSDLLSRVLGTTPTGQTPAPKATPQPKNVAQPVTQSNSSITPAVDETDAMLRGEFAQLMSGGKVKPIDILTGGMYAADQATAQNAQRAADLARQAATVQQQKNPVSPSTPTAQPGQANPPDPNTKGVQAATSWALNNLGIPYSWGGGTPTGPSKGFAQGANTTGYDCSSFVQAAMAKAGVKLPRTTYDQMKVGAAVPNLQTAQPGDLLFPTAGHVMLYLGNGQAAEAPHTGDVTKTIPVTGMSFVSIRRVL